MVDRPLSPADLWQAATAASRRTSKSLIGDETDAAGGSGGTRGTSGGAADGKVSAKNSPKAYATLAWKEAKGKFVWCVAVLLMRIFFGAVKRTASLSASVVDADVPGSMPFELMGHSSELPPFALQIAAVSTAALSSVASLLVLVLPGVLFNPSRLGFLAAFPPLLQLIRSDFKLSDLPLAPTRVSQWMMCKLSTRQLLGILPVYFVTTLMATATVRFVVPTSFMFGGLDPIQYGDNRTDGTLNDVLEWAPHFAKEVMVNAMAVVGLRVVPELLRLNRVGWAECWCILIVVWPLSRIAVDVSGSGSSFAPELVYALRCVRLWDPAIADVEDSAVIEISTAFQLARSAHRLGPIIGGVLAGKIMASFFP